MEIDYLIVGSGFGGSVSGAAADREGLPGPGAGEGAPLRPGGLPGHELEPPAVALDAAARVPRALQDDLPPPRHRALRRRRGRRLAGLRQHPPDAQGPVLRGAVLEPPGRLEGRARAALPDGAADARGDREPRPRPLRRGAPRGGRPRWAARTASSRPGWRSTSARPGRPSRIPTSAARGRRGPAARSAAAA